MGCDICGRGHNQVEKWYKEDEDCCVCQECYEGSIKKPEKVGA